MNPVDFEINQSIAWGSSQFSIFPIVQDVYDICYGHPYPDDNPRVIYGMAHVTRAMMLGAAGYNLMQSAGVEGINDLHQQEKTEEIQFIQIALLIQEMGMTSDSEAMDYVMAGQNAYRYLVNRLNVPSDKAKAVADAIMNQYWAPGSPYCELSIDKGEVNLIQHPSTQDNPFSPSVNRMRLGINFADYLEYQRFSAPYETQYHLLLNQPYEDNHACQIQLATSKIYQETLMMCADFLNAYEHSTDCNLNQAVDFANQSLNQTTHLKYFYHEGNAETLDANAIPLPEREPDPNGFLVKNIGLGISAWPKFVRQIIDHKTEEIREPLRSTAGRYVSRQRYNPDTNRYDTEVIPVEKSNPTRTPLWDSNQKKSTTVTQSMTYAAPDFLPVGYVRNIGEAAEVGIRIPLYGASIARIIDTNAESYYRRYDADSAVEAMRYARQHYLPSLNDYKKNKEFLTQANEVMARIKWDGTDDQYQIVCFKDNLDSRIVAQARSLDIYLADKNRQKESNRPIIIFYPSLREYSQADQAYDLNRNDLPEDLLLLARGIKCAAGDKTVSLDEKKAFLSTLGEHYSIYLNLQILDSEKEPKNLLNVAPPHVLLDILETPDSRYYQDTIESICENKENLCRFLSWLPIARWGLLFERPGVQTRFQAILSTSVDLSRFSLDQHKLQMLINKLSSFDPYQKDAAGHTAIYYAYDHAPAMVNMLIKKGNVDSKEKLAAVLEELPEQHHDQFLNKIINDNVKKWMAELTPAGYRQNKM